MIRFLKVALFSITALTGVMAQNNHTARFIASTQNDSQIIALEQHVSVIKKHSFVMPVLADAEFRVRNRAWDVNGQRYTIKFEPRGLGETRSIKHYTNAQINYEADRTALLFNEKLMSRYILVIDLIERTRLLTAYRELITLYEDRIRVMDQLKNSVDFDLNDLIEAEKDLSKLMIQQLEENQEVANVNEQIALQINEPSFSGFDTTSLVAVPTIKKTVAGMSYDLDANNITLRSMKRQFELAGTRFNYEQAQTRKILSFLEFSYDNGIMIDEKARRNDKRSYDLNQAFIVELGIKIPYLSGGQEDLSRRKIDYMNDEEEYEQVRRELHQKMKKDTSDIRALISQYEFLAARETEVDAEASLKKYLDMTGVDPLALLSIKENLIKNSMERSIVYYSILRNFIYVLDVNGKLAEKPLRNYLADNMETMTP